MQLGKVACPIVMLAALSGAAQAHSKVVQDSNGAQQTLATISDALNQPDHHPVHVIYVHGIDQIGAGDSSLLRESICTKLKLCAVSDWQNTGIEFADKGEFDPSVQPPSLQYLGNPVWTNPEEWLASAPFVVHWMIHLRGNAGALEVDEINWWPLVLALKCRRVVVPEAYLAGDTKQLLQVCSEQSVQNPGGLGRFYPWIPADEAAKLEKIRPRGALLNRTLKDSIVDWGLADVLLSTGQLGGLLRDGIRQLIAKSAAYIPAQPGHIAAGGSTGTYNWAAQLAHDNTLDQEFVGVTHSLGSYLLFNALSVQNSAAGGEVLSAQDAARLTREQNAVRYIFERTSLMYFFANQLQMLEITNLEQAPQPQAAALNTRGLAPPPPLRTASAENFRALVNQWQALQSQFQAALHPNDERARSRIQVVAWSDPSDVITFRVPRIGNVDVVNLYVRNATSWLGLFESPGAAHANYARNKSVLEVMFGDSKPGNAP